jgi:putative membrane protein
MQPNGIFILVLHWIVSAVALMITAYIVPGFRVRDFPAALMAAIVIGVTNIFIGSVLTLVTLPLYYLTFGLFSIVINAIVLKIAAAFLKGFDISSWMSAFVGALILAVVDMGLHWMMV